MLPTTFFILIGIARPSSLLPSSPFVLFLPFFWWTEFLFGFPSPRVTSTFHCIMHWCRHLPAHHPSIPALSTLFFCIFIFLFDKESTPRNITFFPPTSPGSTSPHSPPILQKNRLLAPYFSHASDLLFSLSLVSWGLCNGGVFWRTILLWMCVLLSLWRQVYIARNCSWRRRHKSGCFVINLYSDQSNCFLTARSCPRRRQNSRLSIKGSFRGKSTWQVQRVSRNNGHNSQY